MSIQFNSKLVQAISEEKIRSSYQSKISNIHKNLINKTCLGKEMLGWMDYVKRDNSKLIKEIKSLVNEWKKMKINEVAIVGIGGSYTGIKAILQFVNCDDGNKNIHFSFFNSLAATKNIKYLENLKNKNWAIIVISKSGTTLESAVNFRLLRDALVKKYKSKHNKRIIAITDPKEGVLNKLCQKHNYHILPIYHDIGGRFSTITPVGLLPAALAGININDILAGAKKAQIDLETDDLKKNSAYLYAAYRHYLYTTKKFDIENVIVYEENLESLCIQHRQLFAESEGKNKNSIYPTFSICTTDLHSMGQLLQEGKQVFFETVIKVAKSTNNTDLKKSVFKNDDELDYLVGKSLNDINYLICEAVKKAHSSSGVNILEIILQDMSAYSFGYVYYWLSTATAASALLLGHNPFNQPGVEAYKKLMFKMLGKK